MSKAAAGILVRRCSWRGLNCYDMCCTETIFYTMSVYFMTAKVKRSRYTLAGALLATLAGLAASVLLAGAMQGCFMNYS